MSNCSVTTSSGIEFDILDPSVEMVKLEDICAALSKICRFAGHIKRFYSVAEHSIIGAMYIEPEYRLEFLLHDATEAYIGDVITPLKALLPDYKKIEGSIDSVIRQKFGLPTEHSPRIKEIDLMMLATEKRDLLPENDRQWLMLQGISAFERCDHLRGSEPGYVAELMKFQIKQQLEERKNDSRYVTTG